MGIRFCKIIALAFVMAFVRISSAAESALIQQLRTDLASAQSGDTVTIPDGLHELESALVVPAGVTLEGSGWEKCVLRQNTAKAAAVFLTDGAAAGGGANLQGVTVTGCRTTAGWDKTDPSAVTAKGYNTISWCCISNNTATSESGGVFINSGSVDHCLFAGNSGKYGGAIGRRNNTYGVGGSVTIDTCLFCRNTATGSGGAIGGAGAGCWSTMVLQNCTITANAAGGSGGGFSCPNGYGSAGTTATIVNSIIAGNTAGAGSADAGLPDWDMGTNSKFAAASGNNLVGAGVTLIGSNSAAGDPLIKDKDNDVYLVTKSSPARNLAAAGERPVDLTGADRTDDLTAGCYNYVAETTFTVTIQPYETAFFRGDKLGLSAEVENPPAGVELDYAWTLAGNRGAPVVWAGLAPTNVLDYGAYAVSLDVLNKSTREVLKTAYGDKTVYVTSRTNYVTSARNILPQGPYDAPSCAATNLLDVVEWLIDGSTVVLDGGEHVVTGAVEIAVGAKVVGQGRERTTVRQAGPVRVFLLNHGLAELHGLTISGGALTGAETRGAGVKIAGLGGKVFDCTVTNCDGTAVGTAAGIGISVSGRGLVDRCVVSGCTSKQSGIIGASGVAGMGAAVLVESGTVRNTLMTRNMAQGESSIVGVTASGLLQNCTVVSNLVMGSGYHAVALYTIEGCVENCLVSHNESPNYHASTANVQSPEWSVEPGKPIGRGVYNCYWGVETPLGEAAVPMGSDADLAFRNPARGNWCIRTSSICRNKGLMDASWMMTGKDLDGRRRINSKIVDVGCYEADPIGMAILLR